MPGLDLTGRLKTAIGLARYAYSEEGFRGKQADLHALVRDLTEPDQPDLQLVALASQPSLIVYTKQHPSRSTPNELWIAFGGTPIVDSNSYYWPRDMDSDLVPYRPDGLHVHAALSSMQRSVPAPEQHHASEAAEAQPAGGAPRSWRVHRGFWRMAVDALHGGLVDGQGGKLGKDLGSLLSEYARVQQQDSAALRVFIVGHSAGGSVATLVAMHLLVQGIFSDVACITFGAIMAVNKHAADDLSHAVNGAPDLSSR